MLRVQVKIRTDIWNINRLRGLI
ncbi:hypothetical protein OYC64_015746 [Pagothenia borchgrevinki]|uniref:Uncharacterized protein n=1 Tax=Pagothenia borchgrevinki TaxID=8213 RepID=A0ABD2HGY9_PAGBO